MLKIGAFHRGGDTGDSLGRSAVHSVREEVPICEELQGKAERKRSTITILTVAAQCCCCWEGSSHTSGVGVAVSARVGFSKLDACFRRTTML